MEKKIKTSLIVTYKFISKYVQFIKDLLLMVCVLYVVKQLSFNITHPTSTRIFVVLFIFIIIENIVKIIKTTKK